MESMSGERASLRDGTVAQIIERYRPLCASSGLDLINFIYASRPCRKSLDMAYSTDIKINHGVFSKSDR